MDLQSSRVKISYPFLAEDSHVTIKQDNTGRIVDCLEFQCIWSQGFRLENPDKFDDWFRREFSPDMTTKISAPGWLKLAWS